MATRKTARKSDDKNQVKDVMVDDVLTIESTATLLEAAEQMRDANIGMLPVMEDGVLRGVVTDRDLVVRGMSRDVRPSEVQVADCLTEPARYAEPEWSLDDAMVEMARQHVGRLPVIDTAGKIIGVVTLSSLALRSSRRDDTLETAREVSRRSARIAS
jgi:CBS domain-containing protein